MRRHHAIDAHPLPEPRRGWERVKVLFFLAYIFGGIGLPVIYFLCHERFHDGLPLIWDVPYVVVWAVPIYVLEWRGRSHRKKAGKPPIDPNRRYRPWPVSRQRRRYRGLALTAAIFLFAGIAGSRLYIWVANQGAGLPLAAYTPAQLQAADPAKLPRYIHVTEAVMHPDLAWGKIVSLKYGDELDTYMPVTAPGWTSGIPVGLIEIDKFYSFDPNAPTTQQNEMLPGGAIEGSLYESTLPDWEAAQITRHGWSAASPVFLLEREQLGGVVPGADPETTITIQSLAGIPTVLFGGLALALKLALDLKVRKFGVVDDMIGPDTRPWTPERSAAIGLPPRWLCYVLPPMAFLYELKNLWLIMLFWPMMVCFIVLAINVPLLAAAGYLAFGFFTDRHRSSLMRSALEAKS